MFIKKPPFLLVVIFLFCFFVINQADARSGCCSHHGGVCGCGCCDGSSLSATCAPYYPSCNSAPKPVQSQKTVTSYNNNLVPVNTVQDVKPVDSVIKKIDTKNDITKTLPSVNQAKSTNTATVIPINTTNANSKNDNNGDFWGGLIFWSVVGFIIYLVEKKRRRKK